ncbi:MAG: hypothetical protein JOZ46_12455 [Candidatus Dormibacteraeota bacterium]|nr:hypothetical protein [Candidatus Dormibacteraeota bacterium]MBV9526612.1 hypothetical protein [Candidatus Dormibacteraeota bacterium]
MRATLVCFAAALLVACGQSVTNAPHTQSPASSHQAQAAGPALTGSVQVSEASQLDAQFRVPLSAVPGSNAHTTCAQFAQGTAGSFTAPVFDVKVSDHSVYFDAVVSSGYQGPGTYSSATQPSITGTVAIAVGTDAGQQPTTSIYRSRINGQSLMLVRPDGSGMFQFTTWGSDEVRGDTGSAAYVSGTVSWTCS